MVALSVSDPNVPVTVIAAFPGAAVLVAVNVKMLVPLVGFWEKFAVTPLGKPETERLALTVKPGWGVMVIVELLELP